MSARIVEKRGWFWTALHWLVLLVTIGRNRTFLTGYLTTIGPWIGVPVGWDPNLPEHQPVIAHERRHIRQQERAGLGSALVGMVPWGLFWLLFPLPLGLAWGRYVLERDAYAEGFRVELVRVGSWGGDVAARRRELIDIGVEQLTTGAYGWAWPFPRAVRRWFEEHV